jgi:hypothetical protein
VPGVAFDLKGCRLGMGKGFYDRILGGIRGFKVGVAFSFQVLGGGGEEKGSGGLALSKACRP